MDVKKNWNWPLWSQWKGLQFKVCVRRVSAKQQKDEKWNWARYGIHKSMKLQIKKVTQLFFCFVFFLQGDILFMHSYQLNACWVWNRRLRWPGVFLFLLLLRMWLDSTCLTRGWFDWSIRLWPYKNNFLAKDKTFNVFIIKINMGSDQNY